MTTESVLPRAGPAARAATLLVLCGLVLAAYLTHDLPPPASASAPPARFSAERAMRHVQVLAQSPRPLASSMNTHARDYIVSTLRAMGLQPRIQTATVHRQTIDSGHNVHVTLAVVHNIVVRKAGIAFGHESRPALLVAAHYDSDADTFGAADGAPAAAMLETLRSMQASPALAEDVIFLFTDGDKTGQLGEQAFAEQHPLARRVGLALKFSSLGNHGPLYLYDTAGPAGEAIRRWAKVSPVPSGSSFLRELHRSMQAPVGPLAGIGAPALHFATEQGWLGLLDTPRLLDARSLQHTGDTMLALVSEFAGSRLDDIRAEPDAVYFSLPGIGMAVYPSWLVWPLVCAACLLVWTACATAVSLEKATWVDVAKGAFGFVLVAAGPGAILFIPGQQAPFFPLARDALGLPEVRHLAVGTMLVLALSIVLHRWLRNRAGFAPPALGAQLAIGFLLIPLTLAMPGASYLLAWPLLAAAAAFADLQLRRAAALADPWRLVLLVAGLAPAIMLIVPALREALGVPSPPRLLLGAVLFALILGLGSLLLATLACRFAARTLALAGIGLLALPGAAKAPLPQLPQPNPLVYYKDMPTWSAWWLAKTPAPDTWSRRLFPLLARPGRLVDVFGWDSDDVWYARAQTTDSVSFPYAILLKNDSAPRRHIEFELTSKNRAPHIELSLKGGKPWRVTVDGQEITNDDQIRNWSLSVYGMEDRKLSFSMDLVGDPYLFVQVEEHMPGVPPLALPRPLPDGAFIPATGQTVASDILVFR